MKDFLASYGAWVLSGAIIGFIFLGIILLFQGLGAAIQWVYDRKH